MSARRLVMDLANQLGVAFFWDPEAVFVIEHAVVNAIFTENCYFMRDTALRNCIPDPGA